MTAALRIHSWEISNVLAIASQHVDCHGQSVVISGKNGVGKTSSVESIFFALGGKRPAEPIKRGEKKGYAKLELGPKDGPVEYILELSITPSGAKLTLTNGDGVKVNKPTQLVESFLGKYTMDPVLFMDRRPQDQVDDVLAIAGVEPPIAEVAEITGETHQPKAGESAYVYLARLSADDVGLYYQQRRQAHQQEELKEKALIEQRRLVHDLGGPLNDAGQGAVSEWLQKIESLQLQADGRRQSISEAEMARRKHHERHRELAELEAGAAHISSRIAEVQKQLDLLKNQAEQNEQKRRDLEPIVNELDADAKAAEEVAALTPDPTPEIAKARAKIVEIEQQQAVRTNRRAATEQLDRLAAEHEEAKASHKRQHDILEALRDLRAHLLDGVDLGVTGLTVGDGELRLNEVPFRQASTAQQLRTACAVAMKQPSRLHLLRVDNGERLDAESRELLLSLAEENDWHVILTCVSDSQELQVQIIEADPAAGTRQKVA